MKNFAFKYEKVLQMRIGEENDAKAELASVIKKISEKEEELEKAKLANNEFLDSVNKNCKEGLFAKNLQYISNNKKFLVSNIKRLEKELEDLNVSKTEITEKFIEASKQKKVMENLKEKDELAYKELVAQNESKAIDEIVTYQSTNKRG